MQMRVQIDLYSDLRCPYAYLMAYRLGQLRADYEGQITIIRRSLALPRQLFDRCLVEAAA